MDTKEERFALYPALNSLILELQNETDPYLLYLRGIMLMRTDNRDEAATCFVESVKQKPYNWSCWSQMTQLVNSTDMVSYPVLTLCLRLMSVYRFERTYSALSYADVCGYHRYARSTYRYRLDAEYDQGIGRCLPR